MVCVFPNTNFPWIDVENSTASYRYLINTNPIILAVRIDSNDHYLNHKNIIHMREWVKKSERE